MAPNSLNFFLSTQNGGRFKRPQYWSTHVWKLFFIEEFSTNNLDSLYFSQCYFLLFWINFSVWVYFSLSLCKIWTILCRSLPVFCSHMFNSFGSILVFFYIVFSLFCKNILCWFSYLCFLSSLPRVINQKKFGQINVQRKQKQKKMLLGRGGREFESRKQKTWKMLLRRRPMNPETKQSYCQIVFIIISKLMRTF